MNNIVKKFNEKVQILNQSGSKELTLGAKEARDLHHAIFNMLERISELEKARSTDNVVELIADGGKF